MYAIWIVVALGMLAGAYALSDSESAPPASSPSAMNLAMNMSQYRQAVVAFATANPSFTGSVPLSGLQPYLGSNSPNPTWQNYVVPNVGYTGSLVVIYASSPTPAGVTQDVERLAQGSALAGVAFNNTVVSPGNPPVALPGEIASGVPNGVPVWMAQAYE
jgi:PilM